MNLEEFKRVEDYPDYLVSEYGVVWDTRQNKELKWIKNNGFCCVNMYDRNGKKVLNKIHQVVYRTFVDTSLRKGTKLEHADGNRSNNRHKNIRQKVPYRKGISFQEFYIHSGNQDKTNKEHARAVWYNMMGRCYDVENTNYKFYGGRGITVCKEWHSFEIFLEWFLATHISGFAMDKDFVSDSLEYSPKTCVFIPRSLNSLIAQIRAPSVRQGKRGKYRLEVSVNSRPIYFKGNSADECFEQYNLVRQLQLEKLMYLMNQYHTSLKEKYPTTPEIDRRVLDKLAVLVS